MKHPEEIAAEVLQLPEGFSVHSVFVNLATLNTYNSYGLFDMKANIQVLGPREMQVADLPADLPAEVVGVWPAHYPTVDTNVVTEVTLTLIKHNKSKELVAAFFRY